DKSIPRRGRLPELHFLDLLRRSADVVLSDGLLDDVVAFFLRDAPEEDEHVTKMLHDRYEKLPRTSYAEKSVMFCSRCCWRCGWAGTGIVPGFGNILRRFISRFYRFYTDATSAILVSMLLFVLPAEQPDSLRILKPEEVKKGRPDSWIGRPCKFPFRGASFCCWAEGFALLLA
ncbi:unnamed protein product, partial [Mesorhabditis spiculigera]